MTQLHLEFLLNASIGSIISNLDKIFENLLEEIKSYLNLDLIYSTQKIIFWEEDEASENLKQDFFTIGVKKAQKNNSLTISLSNKYKKYLRIILLHEAYKCFVPLNLQDKEIINIFINQKVEIDLQKSENIKEWKAFKRKSVISYEFLEAEFDRLENFLEQEGGESQPSPFQFFFSYIRKNMDLIGNTKDKFISLETKSFFTKIFQEYTLRYIKYPDEILETIRIITWIFNKVETYKSLLDYQLYFKDYKESGLIQTKLSLRKFTENMQWIKTYTYLAPSYKLNWFALEIMSILCFMRFHPIIKTSQIIKVIKQLPFFNLPSFSKNNFGIEFIGYFIFPKVYYNDLTAFIGKLESEGYIIEKKLFILKNTVNTINLNFVKRRDIILNPNKREYKEEFQIESSMDYGHGTIKSNLTLLDWLLIDRIRSNSITGFGFERRSETLNNLKSDLLNEIESQRKLIIEIKENLNNTHLSSDFEGKILDLINNNQPYGFFYIKQMLNDYLTLFRSIVHFFEENSPSIKNYFEFQEYIKTHGISRAIEDNILLNNLQKIILKDLNSSYFKTKQRLNEKVNEYRKFYNLFKSFYDLKLFNLESIKSIVSDNSLIQNIYNSKDIKLKKKYESYKTYKITNQLIEERLEHFLNEIPPVIQPFLLNTILISLRLTKYYPLLILKDTLQTREGIEKIKWLFPQAAIVEMSEYNTMDNFIYLRFKMPNLSLKEKQLMYSVFYNLLGKDIIIGKFFLYSGFMEHFSIRDFYDLEQEGFFYTKDLFDQFFLFVQKTFNIDVVPISESNSTTTGILWPKQKFMSHLINDVENRISKEQINLEFINLDKLKEYNKNLEENLTNLERFKHSKIEFFFKNYVKAIKFIPSFQSFGLGQYFIYFYPTDLRQIDFRHFLHNSFQKIKFPASIDKTNSFLIKFIWPYRNPNNSLLNWLNKSKKVIREYCLYFIKRIFQIFHFDYNLSTNEWDLDPNRFKIYFQNILFNPEYSRKISMLKELSIGDLNLSNYLPPNSSEYNALIQLYNWKSIDIKSYIGTRNYSVVNHIFELIEKKLIFPYISVKNLDLKNKIYIILPDVKKEYNETILKIFSFFNIGFIFEIEGEYYIQGFTEEVKFENGLMIKLYLPDCQLDEFEILFDLIFEYLKIEHYIVLNDLVDGKDFLRSIYANLDFLKSYNPLKNLIWNNKDKIWMNPKLFTNKFEKIYPPLKIDD